MGSINLKGAQIDDLLLIGQKQSMAKNSPPIRLLSPLGTPHAYIAQFGWTGQGVATPNLDTLWTADSDVLSPGHPIGLTTEGADGLKYQITIAVDDGYLFTVDQRVTNASGRPVAVRPVGLLSRSGQSADHSTWQNHVGPITLFDGKADYDINWKDLDEGKSEAANGVSGWLGFTDKYWLAALIPATNAAMSTEFTHSPSGAYQADYALAPKTLAPGQVLSTQTRLFAGAKEKAWLDRYENAGIPKLSKSIDWGWFEWFMRPIFDLLLFLFRVTGNFGLAIIGLTLIVRGIMFPIAQKQFQSMAAMRKIQPKMKALQERFKDDKARQQQEILKLYQAEKINPAAGCLPIMPWVLVFIMAPFAAGLQLYWMTNNILTIAQQWWLYRKYGLHLSDTHPVQT
jgi:YidC/Oxa1 family membrane protein insertase